MADQSHIEWTDAARTVGPRGYVLIKLRQHPRADVRGYVYEHLLVMERALGRPLIPGERVRHRDNRPGNNEAANLQLVPPLDRAATTECVCGCGTTMTVLDDSGRRRQYVSGHNSRSGVRDGSRPKAETGAGLSDDVKADLTERFGGQCAYGCGRAATCWDHLIPWSSHGTFAVPGNAVPACAPCNSEKSYADPWPWIDRGMDSEHADAWLDLVALGLSWGQLDQPDEHAGTAVTA